MPFEQAHADALATHAAELAAAKAQHEVKQAAFDSFLLTLSDGLAEGDVLAVNGPTPGVTKVGGVVKYVMIPGLAGAGAGVGATA